MKKLTIEEYINRANQKHHFKYDYSQVVYKGMRSKINVICPDHGPFLVEASNHISPKNRCGCPKCGRRDVIHRNRAGCLSNEEFIRRSIAIHGDKYDYSRCSYQNLTVKVEIICPFHGLFQQRPENHLAGCGCRKCKNSHGQTKIATTLDNMGIKYAAEYIFDDCINPKTGRPLKFDFYLPDYHSIIEYDGEQHFMPVRFHQSMTELQAQESFEQTRFRDVVKDDYIQQQGLSMLRISYKSKNDIHQLVKHFLSC